MWIWYLIIDADGLISNRLTITPVSIYCLCWFICSKILSSNDGKHNNVLTVVGQNCSFKSTLNTIIPHDRIAQEFPFSWAFFIFNNSTIIEYLSTLNIY